jgi:hypothetical protein
MITFARDVLDRVASFVDHLLAAFERGTARAMARR